MDTTGTNDSIFSADQCNLLYIWRTIELRKIVVFAGLVV